MAAFEHCGTKQFKTIKLIKQLLLYTNESIYFIKGVHMCIKYMHISIFLTQQFEHKTSDVYVAGYIQAFTGVKVLMLG